LKLDIRRISWFHLLPCSLNTDRILSCNALNATARYPPSLHYMIIHSAAISCATHFLLCRVYCRLLLVLLGARKLTVFEQCFKLLKASAWQFKAALILRTQLDSSRTISGRNSSLLVSSDKQRQRHGVRT